MTKRLALTVDGNITYCTASDANIGKGRCNHIAHQKDGQSIEDFVSSIDNEINSSALKTLRLKELKDICNNKEHIDFIKKLEIEYLLKYLISQGETDFSDLAKSDNEEMKYILAENGLNLEILKDDKNDEIREQVASKGYNLENYINDESCIVRAEIAHQGYGLDKLVNDNHYLVRMAVAEQ